MEVLYLLELISVFIAIATCFTSQCDIFFGCGFVLIIFTLGVVYNLINRDDEEDRLMCYVFIVSQCCFIICLLMLFLVDFSLGFKSVFELLLAISIIVISLFSL